MNPFEFCKTYKNKYVKITNKDIILLWHITSGHTTYAGENMIEVQGLCISYNSLQDKVPNLLIMDSWYVLQPHYELEGTVVEEINEEKFNELFDQYKKEVVRKGGEITDKREENG